MKPIHESYDQEIDRLFDSIRRVPSLEPQAAAQERASFLRQGAILQAAVSARPQRRHREWIDNLTFALFRKEHNRMLNILAALIITFSVIMGGAGATVYAAQSSQPDELLYPVKLFSEDARLELAGTDAEKLELMLEYTDRRMAEIGALQTQGLSVPEKTAARLQTELQTALQLAAGLDEKEMIQALNRIRTQAEIQIQQMEAMQSGQAAGSVEMQQIQTSLQEQIRLAAEGESNPQGFKQQMQTQNKQNSGGNGDPIHTPAPTGGSYGPGAGGQPTGTPGGYGPGGSGAGEPSQTPVPTGGSYGPGPGGSYGPGPGGQMTGTPGGSGAGGSGPGEPSQTPAPTGSSYGPGAGSGAGEQPTSTPGGYGAGEPTRTPIANGTGPQPTTTCTPVQNSGGQTPQPSMTPQSGGSGNGGQMPTPGTGSGSGGGGKP